MKVLLLGRVENLGEAGDVVDVADNVARDVLFPQERAVVATGSQSENTPAAKVSEQELAAFQRLADRTDQKTVRVERPMNPDRSLQKPVTAKDITAAIAQAIGTSLPAGVIRLSQLIEEPGHYSIPLEFPHGLESEIKLIVEPANETPNTAGETRPKPTPLRPSGSAGHPPPHRNSSSNAQGSGRRRVEGKESTERGTS